MNRYIALLRGVNVGGHKKIRMADLKLLFESMGFTEVLTYIQSGNVAFSFEGETTSEAISKAIQKSYGWDVPVLLRTAKEIKSILDACPFPKEKKENSYFMLLFDPPSEENIKNIETYQYPNEEYVITPQCAYLYCSVGYHKSKLGGILDKKLKVNSTTRNYRTMVKLLEIAAG